MKPLCSFKQTKSLLRHNLEIMAEPKDRLGVENSNAAEKDFGDNLLKMDEKGAFLLIRHLCRIDKGLKMLVRTLFRYTRICSESVNGTDGYLKASVISLRVGKSSAESDGAVSFGICFDIDASYPDRPVGGIGQ